MKKVLLGILVIVLLPACSIVSPTATIGSPDAPAAHLLPIQDYLVEHIGLASFGGKVFCSYDVLGEEMNPDEANVYVWTLCAEYYLDGKNLTMGTASSLPVALYMQVSGGEYRVTGSEVPSDGMGYSTSIRRIFPKDAIKRMCESNVDCYSERAERLDDSARQQAVEYYDLD